MSLRDRIKNRGQPESGGEVRVPHQDRLASSCVTCGGIYTTKRIKLDRWPRCTDCTAVRFRLEGSRRDDS